MVQMLLDKGAEVNAQGGHYDNALQAASAGGHHTVVQMLLDQGVLNTFLRDADPQANSGFPDPTQIGESLPEIICPLLINKH